MARIKLKPNKNGRYYCPIHPDIEVYPFILLNGFRYWTNKKADECHCLPPRPSNPTRVK